MATFFIFALLHMFQDGKDLPKVIGFEGEDEEAVSTSLLPTIHMKMENCQPEAEKIILQFLQEYFKVILILIFS